MALYKSDYYYYYYYYYKNSLQNKYLKTKLDRIERYNNSIIKIVSKINT